MPHSFRTEEIPTGDLQALFDLCNTRYFDAILAPSPGFKLRFSRSVKLSGCFHYCRETRTDWGIDIARRLQNHPRAMLSTMVHEMIHMLAHQYYRQTGNLYYLDEQPHPENPAFSRGHGPFFTEALERLNRTFPELSITIKSTFGDELYEPNHVEPVRLLLVYIDQEVGKGMVYRLHPKAGLEWAKLQETAMHMHGVLERLLV